MCFGQSQLHLHLAEITDSACLDSVDRGLLTDRRQRVSMSVVPNDSIAEAFSERNIRKSSAADAFMEQYKRKYTSPLIDF